MKSEVFNADRQRNVEINNLLQRIRYEMGNLRPEAKYVFLPTIILDDGRPMYQKDVVNLSRLNELKDMGAVEVEKRSIEEMNKTLKETGLRGLIVEGAFVELIEPAFSRLCSKYEKLVRSTEDNTLTKGKKRMPTIYLRFPEIVRFEKVTLKIKEGRQEVEIFYDNSHIITTDYRQLRFFVGKRQQKPDRQWGFLCALSTISATDIKQATAENMRRMITKNKTLLLSINNVQQVKKLFVERLQDIFKTHDDPFHDRRDYYHPKFTILPEPTLRREEIWPQGGRLNENRAYENRSHEPKFISNQDSKTSYEDTEEAL